MTQQKKQGAKKPKKQETQSLAALKRLWYNKLAETGFKDIEDTTEGKDRLVHWDSMHFNQKRYRDGQYISTEEYFSNARALVHTQVFNSTMDKRVWSMHAEGKSVRWIADHLRLTKSTVHNIVSKYKQSMLRKR